MMFRVLVIFLLSCSLISIVTANDWPSPRVDSLVKRAARHFIQQEYEEALRVAQFLIQEYPDHAEAHVYLATIYSRIQKKTRLKKDYQEEGLDACDRAAVLLAESVDVGHKTRRNLARLYQRWEEWEKAILHYQIMLDSDSTDTMAQLGMATSLQKLGRFKEAWTYYNRIRRYAPAWGPAPLIDSPIPGIGDPEVHGEKRSNRLTALAGAIL
jgi:tetratricopeptide (TPR) repeat protein